MHTLFYTSNRDQYITITSHSLSCKLIDLKKQTMAHHTLRFEILKVVNAMTTVFLNVTNTSQS